MRNIWLNQLRHQRTIDEFVELHTDGSEPNGPVDRTPDPHTGYVGNLEREQVRPALRELPVEFREVITLREYEERSYREIAALLDGPTEPSCRDGQVRARGSGSCSWQEFTRVKTAQE